MARLAFGSQTDLGRARSVNEDAALIADDLFVVADGMGGHSGGDVASELAVTIMADQVVEPSTEALVAAVQEANRRINNRAASEPHLTGMGTTLTAMAVVGQGGAEKLAIVNVGDSRAYRLDDGELVQITDDHSVVGEMIRSGQLDRSEAMAHPQRNILTRALGVSPTVEVDSFELELRPGDRFLLCSDGLFSELNESLIAATLRKLAVPQEAATELVRLAVEAGGRDNVTAVVVDVLEPDADGEASGVVGARVTRSLDTTPDVAGFGSAVVPEDPEATDGRDSGPVTLASGRELVPPEPPVQRVRRARITWRVLVLILALALVAGVAALAVSVVSRGTYFVGFDGDEVAIFKGRPGGVLWIDPTVEQRSGLCRTEVGARYLTVLERGRSYGELASAEAFVDNLIDEAEADGATVDGDCGSSTASENVDSTAPTSAPRIPTTRPLGNPGTTAP